MKLTRDQFLKGNGTLVLGIVLVIVSAGLLLSAVFAEEPAPTLASLPVAAPGGVAPGGSIPIGDSTAAQNYADGIIREMQARVAAHPNDHAAYASLGTAYEQKARETSDPGYYTEADKALRKALELKPDYYDALASMGALSLSRHNFAEAQEWGKKAIAVVPDRAYGYGVLGDGQIEVGEYDAAIQTFQKMMDLGAGLSAYSRTSYARELLGDVPGAVEAMQQAIDAGSPAAENTAWCRMQLGNLYFNSNRVAEAEQAYQASLANYPNYMHALAGMANVRWAQGKPQEAIEYYKKAVANVPLPQYLASLGDMYVLAGDKKAAKEQYETVDYIYILFEKNGVKVDIEQAEYMADHDIDLAAALKKAEAVMLERHDVHSQDRYAWVLYKNGRYQDALKAETQAMRLGTQNPLFFYHMGMIQSKLGNSVEARKNVQKALDLNPYFSPLYSGQAEAFVGK